MVSVTKCYEVLRSVTVVTREPRDRMSGVTLPRCHEMSRVSRSARPRGGATPRTPQVAASWPRPPRMRSAQQTPAPVTSVQCRGPGRGGTTDHTRCVDNTSDYPTLDNYVIQTVDVDPLLPLSL